MKIPVALGFLFLALFLLLAQESTPNRAVSAPRTTATANISLPPVHPPLSGARLK